MITVSHKTQKWTKIRDMRFRTYLCGFLAAMLFTSEGVSSQSSRAQLTVGDITTKIGSAADARAIFTKLFAAMFQQGERTEFLLRSQVRPDWLPKLERVDLVLTTEVEVASLSKCNLYWTVGSVVRSGNGVSVRLGQRCGGTVLEYRAEFDGAEWRLVGAPGIGSGFNGRPIGCPCVP